jgi:hypothetical protein
MGIGRIPFPFQNRRIFTINRTMGKKTKQGKKPGNRKNIAKNRTRIEANHAILKKLK